MSALKSDLKWTTPSDTQGQWLLKSVFWLVAAKILRDKDVPGFGDLDLSHVDAVFSLLAQHYGSDRPVSVADKRRREALQQRAADIDRTQQDARVRILDRRGRAGPRLHGAAVVLGREDLDGVVDGEEFIGSAIGSFDAVDKNKDDQIDYAELTEYAK